MKRSKKERKVDCLPKCGTDLYGYGLRITLNEDELQKLDKDIGDFKVGSYVTLQAYCCVKAVRQSTNEDSNSSSVELQMEKIGVEQSSKSLKDAVDQGVSDAVDDS
jgi:hypothetical protein